MRCASVTSPGGMAAAATVVLVPAIGLRGGVRWVRWGRSSLPAACAAHPPRHCDGLAAAPPMRYGCKWLTRRCRTAADGRGGGGGGVFFLWGRLFRYRGGGGGAPSLCAHGQ